MTLTQPPQNSPRDSHGGIGRRRSPRTPKGRQVDPQALEQIRALLGDRERRRDLLIEHLHLIQDRYGHLSAAHLAALAQEMRLALTEVYEVATFYAHFDVVKEGETPPPAVTVRVCDSLSCALKGAERLLAELPNHLGPGVRVVRAPCMGACDRAPGRESSRGRGRRCGEGCDARDLYLGHRTSSDSHAPWHPGGAAGLLDHALACLV